MSCAKVFSLLMSLHKGESLLDYISAERCDVIRFFPPSLITLYHVLLKTVRDNKTLEDLRFSRQRL
jgi:hypothetical protein